MNNLTNVQKAIEYEIERQVWLMIGRFHPSHEGQNKKIRFDTQNCGAHLVVYLGACGLS